MGFPWKNFQFLPRSKTDTMDDVISYGYIENSHMHPHRNQGLEMVLVESGVLNWAVDGVAEELKPDCNYSGSGPVF